MSLLPLRCSNHSPKTDASLRNVSVLVGFESSDVHVMYHAAPTVSSTDAWCLHMQTRSFIHQAFVAQEDCESLEAEA